MARRALRIGDRSSWAFFNGDWEDGDEGSLVVRPEHVRQFGPAMQGHHYAFFKDAAFCTSPADRDGDGYGSSPDCLGMDCDDYDDTVHEGCAAGCQDNDGDGYGTGGDCLGSDCNDEDPDCAFGACCGECPSDGGMCMAAARAHHAILPLADDDIWVVLGGEPGGLLVDAEFVDVDEKNKN